MFRAQRNIYLAGSTLVLLVILNRLYSLSREVVVLTASNESMKRQAQSSSEFAAQLLANEKDDTKKAKPKEEPKPASPKHYPESTDEYTAAGSPKYSDSGLRQRGNKKSD